MDNKLTIKIEDQNWSLPKDDTDIVLANIFLLDFIEASLEKDCTPVTRVTLSRGNYPTPRFGLILDSTNEKALPIAIADNTGLLKARNYDWVDFSPKTQNTFKAFEAVAQKLIFAQRPNGKHSLLKTRPELT